MSDGASLELQGVYAGYGDEAVLRDLSFALAPGQFGAILGPNGAGKTTTLRSVMGMAQVLSGDVILDGQRITNTGTRQVVSHGISLSPEGRQVFPSLSVEENLSTGALTGSRWRERKARMDHIFGYFPVLRDRLGQRAGSLSGGEQQMLAVGRALMSGPRVLLVDEASLGLAPVMVERLFDLLAQVNADGVTVLAVEQNVAICGYATHVWVIHNGGVRFGGAVDDIQDELEREVASAYLGRDERSSSG